MANDHQATAQLSINATTLEVSRRRQLPFGVSRGEVPAVWPAERGFVGGALDASTGLTHLGAREYDPALGRFISVDPIMDLASPQQMHGYTYANNTPVTSSDPDGLRPICGMGDECGYEGAAWASNPVKADRIATGTRAKRVAKQLVSPVTNKQGKTVPKNAIDGVPGGLRWDTPGALTAR